MIVLQPVHGREFFMHILFLDKKVQGAYVEI